MSNDEWFRVLDGGGVLLLVVLLVVGWWVARRHGPAVMAAAMWAPIGAVLAVLAVRPVYQALGLQPASDPNGHSAVIVIYRTADGIWPSRHAALAGAVAVGLFFVRRRLGAIAGAVGVIMGAARVLTGVHYPSDAVTGLVLGGLVSGIGFVLIKGLLVLVVTRLRTSPLRPLVGRRPLVGKVAG